MLVNLSVMWLPVVIVVMGLSSAGARTQLVFENGAYSRLRLRIDENLSVQNCRDTLSNLEALINETSYQLHQLTNHQTWIRDLEIVLPSSWRVSACQPGRQVVSMGNVVGAADIVVTDSNPSLGSIPWTLQTHGCGNPGDQINLPTGFLQYNASKLQEYGSVMLKEWAKYRYGVFEEKGFTGDLLYPEEYIEGNITVRSTGCIQNNNIFCPLTSAYNKNSLTKQNILCNGKSAMEVILDNKDFQNPINPKRNEFIVESTTDPPQKVYNVTTRGARIERSVPDIIASTTFRYVENSANNYVVILDQTASMDFNNRWVNVKRAFYRFIDILPEGSILSIITFGEKPSLVLPPTVVTEGNREGLHGRIPRRILENDQACVHCAFNLSLKTLKDSSGSIILLTGFPKRPVQFKKDIEKVMSRGVQLFTISYPSTTWAEMTKLAYLGKSYAVHEDTLNGNQLSHLNEILIDIVNNVETRKVEKIHESQHLSYEFAGTFVVEESLRKDIMVTLSIEDEQKVEYFEVNDPSGKQNIFSKFEDGMVFFKFSGISDTGIWSFHAKLYPDAGLPSARMTIDVIARGDSKAVTVETFTNIAGALVAAPDTPIIIFAKVQRSHAPVLGAVVEAVIGRPDDDHINAGLKIQLRDTGTGYPDITGNDGVYSGYLPQFSTQPGYYTIRLQVSDKNGNASSPRSTGLEVKRCCGSKIWVSTKVPTGQFTRYVAGPAIYMQSGVLKESDISPPARITNLRIKRTDTNTSSLQISLSWSAPGGDYDYGNASRYEIRCYTSRDGLTEQNFHEKGILVHASVTPKPLSYGSPQTCIAGVPWPNQVFYYAIVAFDDNGNRGPISNLVSVYRQEVTTTIAPVTVSLAGNPFLEATSPRHGGKTWFLDKNQIFVIAGIGGGILLVIISVVICLLIKSKKTMTRKSKEVQDSYEAGFDPDVKQNKKEETNSNGIYNWLDTLPRADSCKTDVTVVSPNTSHEVSGDGTLSRKPSALTNRQKVLTNGSFLNLKDLPSGSDEGSNASRPTTSTDDSISDNGFQAEDKPAMTVDLYPSVKRSNTSASINGFPSGQLDDRQGNRSPTQDAYAHQVFSRSMNYYSFREPASNRSTHVQSRPLGGLSEAPHSMPGRLAAEAVPEDLPFSANQIDIDFDGYTDFSIPYNGEFSGPYHPVSDVSEPHHLASNATCHRPGPPVPVKPWKKKRHESVV